MLSSKHYKEIENRSGIILDNLMLELPADLNSSVQHYINHAELEIAYELFGLYLLEEKLILSHDLVKEIEQVGTELDFENKASMYDPNFWHRFSHFLNSRL